MLPVGFRFAWLVIVAALPVQEPDEPVTLPVTLPVTDPITFPVTLPVTAPVKGPENDVASTPRFNTKLFEAFTYSRVGLLAYVPIVKPAPFAAAAVTASFAILIFKSVISKVVELTVVVVPFTVKFPPTIRFVPIVAVVCVVNDPTEIAAEFAVAPRPVTVASVSASA